VTTVQKKQGRISLTGYLAIVLALIGLAGLYVVRWSFDADVRRQALICRTDTHNLSAAMKGYQRTYGKFPVGDNATILKALRGENPKRSHFFDVRSGSLDEHGAFIDPWRTPYLIETNLTNGISIRSAGPNRGFGDADDVTNPH